MVKRLQEIKSDFRSSDGMSFPESFIATLKVGIAKKVAGSCDGILMNFCSPAYAGGVAKSVRESYGGNLEIACYLKTFFSKSTETATKLAINEFGNYDMLVHYHKMFEKRRRGRPHSYGEIFADLSGQATGNFSSKSRPEGTFRIRFKSSGRPELPFRACIHTLPPGKRSNSSSKPSRR